MSTPDRFDLLGPLPTGTTLLVASAGTGKTFTIAALATRYIAEGAATIDQMLMITFGRSATRELRERVREALTRARDALRGQYPTDDPVIASLLALPGDERRAAADRLARAVADFDAGTIATTHQFCSTTLSGLGLSADTDPGEVFVESISELVDEVVDDFYVRKYGGQHTVTDRIPYTEARDIARRAVGDPQASLAAGPVADGSIGATRQSFAEAVRAEVLRRRRARRWVTFDDLVLRLEAALTDPVTGEQARRHLRTTYRVVLVDEFQDTDPAQWTILREAFHGSTTLILIGDPKQAIYAFRGADIFSYLDAVGHADRQATLPTNWRSDAAVVNGVEAIMGDMQLGDPRIVVGPVEAAHDQSRLQGVASQARVRLRVVPKKSGKLPGVYVQRTTVAADVADDIVATLLGPARLTDASGPRPVAPGDIAVLVGTHVQAALVRDALGAADVPAVVTSPTSVFATAAASQWADLLRAMQRPRGSALRAAGLTDFVGYSPEALATDGDRLDTDLVTRLREWSQVLEQDSVAEMVAAIERETGVAARVLSRPDGERHLTDLRHLAGVLHTHQRRSHVGLVGLYDWLGEQMRSAQESLRDSATELTRRLETDAEAVQVLTVHVSKGLEFPIVYVPFGWDRYPQGDDGPLLCHAAQGRRVLDVRGPGAVDRDQLLAARNAESAGEDLRMLYVAMTRASSQLVVHWAPSPRNTKCAPLHRLLSARLAGSHDPEQSYPVGKPPAFASEWVAVEDVDPGSPAHRWEPAAAQLPRLAAAPFTRQVDTVWRRTSYSGLTREVHAAEHRPSGFRDDEPEEILGQTVDVTAEPGLDSPFADMPAGAAFGTLVHQVLEAVQTPADLADRCREQVAAFPVAGVEAEALAQALLPVMQTPLGPLAADLTLAGIPPADRLAELDFELPMGGPATATLSDLAALLRRYVPNDDPLAGYADLLDTPGLAESALVGYLTGSIDVVLRVPGATPRFLVVDYKTNLLRDPARPGVEGLVEGYRPERLAEAMMDAHYPLQALLYSAALHRFLRWRLPAYDPAVHLGGVLYLFLRGMAGPDTPAGCGVFSWQPPAGLIEALSDLLDGRPS
ncbi:MAG TPA: UvrD-helicase domain-containing protein [Actinomycetota bacterium]|nr:UvrD-helicase domain-containing protein [Actinomycetota bacterium]